MIRAANDYMIQNLDFEQLASANKIAGYFDVGFGWGGIHSWVIMHYNNGISGADYCQPENLAGVDK